MHAGLYKGDRHNYVDPLSTTFDGAYLLTAKGTPERPIVIEAAGDGEVIFDGDGAFRLFDVMGADYNIFDGLTIRNTEVAFWAGVKDVAGAKGLTVRNCRIENVGVGVNAQYAGSKDFYIADNVFLGRDDRHRVLGWANPGLYGAHPINSYYAIKVYGSGHVIAHNAVAFFHDGISVCTHGVPEPRAAICRAVAIDIYNNDISRHRRRLHRSRRRRAQHPRDAQPRRQRGAHGAQRAADLRRPRVLHPQHRLQHAGRAEVHQSGRRDRATTTRSSRRTGPRSASRTRTSRTTCSSAPTRRRGSRSLGGPTAYSTYDYNGFRPNRGAEFQYTWLGTEARRARRLRPSAEAGAALRDARGARGRHRPGDARHRSGLRHLRETCAPPSPPDSSKPGHALRGGDLNFRLKPGSKAVDAGVRLPNVNDGFSGRAPDLGAYEVGQPAPVYGPRWLKEQPFYR